MGLRIDFCPTEKKNLGIWLHSTTIYNPAKSSQAGFRRVDKLRLFQESRIVYRLTRIVQPVFL